MIGKFAVPELSLLDQPPVVYCFQAIFFAAGIIPNPLDIRFQKISGLSVDINTTSVNEGGMNLYSHKLPNKINYNNVTFERGMVVGSPLNIEFNLTMSTFKFATSNVLVMLLNQDSVPVSGWLFYHAYPVKWTYSDLDANSNSIMIQTMELAYKRFQTITI